MRNVMKLEVEFVEKYKGKSVTILWSGGLDSNMLLALAIKAECKIQLLSIESPSLPNLEAEQINRERVLDILRPNYNIEHKIFKIGHLSPVPCLLAQMRVWASIMPIAYGKYTDHVMIGYVMSDQALSYLDDLQSYWQAGEVFHDYDCGNYPELSFPITKLHKHDIMAYLHKCHPELDYHHVYCENPKIRGEEKIIIACKECPSCKKMEDLGTDNPAMYTRDIAEDDKSELIDLN